MQRSCPISPDYATWPPFCGYWVRNRWTGRSLIRFRGTSCTWSMSCCGYKFDLIYRKNVEAHSFNWDSADLSYSCSGHVWKFDPSCNVRRNFGSNSSWASCDIYSWLVRISTVWAYGTVDSWFLRLLHLELKSSTEYLFGQVKVF